MSINTETTTLYHPQIITRHMKLGNLQLLSHFNATTWRILMPQLLFCKFLHVYAERTLLTLDSMITSGSTFAVVFYLRLLALQFYLNRQLSGPFWYISHLSERGCLILVNCFDQTARAITFIFRSVILETFIHKQKWCSIANYTCKK